MTKGKSSTFTRSVFHADTLSRVKNSRSKKVRNVRGHGQVAFVAANGSIQVKPASFLRANEPPSHASKYYAYSILADGITIRKGVKTFWQIISIMLQAANALGSRTPPRIVILKMQQQGREVE